MKKVKGILFAVCIMGVCMFDSVALASEAFFTNPGTRAMSMGGAFTAQADDSTAIWYNPAGLYQTGYPGDFTVEGGSMPSISDSGQYNITDEIKLKYVGLKGAGKKDGWSFGIAHFEPYRLATIVQEKVYSTDTKAIGRVDVDYRQLSFAAAGGGDRLSLGVSGDVLMLGVNAKNYSGVIDDPSGAGGSIGGLYKIVAGENFNMKVGAVYRSKITTSSKDDSSSSNNSTSTCTSTECIAGNIIAKYLPGRPESRSIGVNVSFPVSTINFDLNAGYEETLWSEAYSSKIDATGSDYQKSMYGVEVTWSSLMVRAGLSKATPADTSKYATIDSITYGLGLKDVFVKGFYIDLGAENKTFSGDSNKYNLGSMSCSYQWE